MKYLRILSIALCCLLLIGMLVACKDGDEADTDAKTEPKTSESINDTEPEGTEPEGTEPEDTEPEDTEPEDTTPPYTGPAIRNETWDTGNITPGSSSVALDSGANDPSVDWN